MKVHYKMITLCALCSVLAVACSPKKNEEKQLPPATQQEKKSDTFLSYPDNKDLEEQKEGLKPSEQEKELQKDEDNVMNPLPG